MTAEHPDPAAHVSLATLKLRVEPKRTRAKPIAARAREAWTAAHAEHLSVKGFAVTERVLDPKECAALVRGYGDSARFRKTVTMARHGFGQGEYRYFAEPLPAIVQALREAWFTALVPLANRWREQLGHSDPFPAKLDAFRRLTKAEGQAFPTPLMLKYGPGDFNCLHQDLYGDVWFPLQVIVLLSDPRSFDGGEIVLVEQRPRAQSRPIVVPLEQGQCAIIPCHHRPKVGARGAYRVAMRHGVSELRSGERYTLGIIFHDARS